MNDKLSRLIDILKQGQAIVAAILPILSGQVNLILFLNLQIGIDLWLPTAICAIVLGATIYNMAETRKTMGIARKCATYGGVIVVVSFVLLLGVVTLDILANQPRLEDFSVRFLFFSMFVSLASPIAWSPPSTCEIGQGH